MPSITGNADRSLNLARVRRFRSKATAQRLEIVLDAELKNWFAGLPGSSHAERLQALRDCWETRPAAEPDPPDQDYGTARCRAPAGPAPLPAP